MTSVSIKDAVLGNLDANNQDNAAITLFDVYGNMTLAQREICLTFPIREVDNCIKTITFNVVSGTYQYQFQTDHLKLLALWVDYVNSISTTNPGIEVTEGPATGHYPLSEDARPSKLFPKMKPMKNGFDIRPIPDASVTDGFRMQYIQKLDDLNATTDPTLRDHLEEALIELTTYRCAVMDDYNMNMAMVHLKKFNEIKQSFFI